MFSGIVAEVGTVESVAGGAIRVRAAESLRRTRMGGSIAVNGVCLTAAGIADGSVSADVMPETLRSSALGRLAPGAPVNLEPALGFGDEVGGHLVQGHVDGIGAGVEVGEEGDARWVRVRGPEEVRIYCAPKAAIAIDGISLTIAAVDGDVIAVSLIPHTLESTIAAGYRPGAIVNLEADVLAKYVARYLDESQVTPKRSTGVLKGAGGHKQTETA